ncbi:septum site-determining protein Ssd [Natronoglycomyces albus]|uniref:Rv3660c-like CheY-like N-terminal domain-containing protein n=1 Tax=Natronoglycomyces albus TaxID=2811108 RepID=A0A895XQM8_9ACTN|nr:septum site-determining protein Ssd [Natronoglycomyces albus]QSB05455.1 hypothetical protein JQS30_00470 [Natronoglycomyces albus]
MRPIPSFLISRDRHLIKHVTTIAAACGHPLVHVPTLEEARMHWQTSPLVLVGSDQAANCAAAGLAARHDVIVLKRQTSRAEPVWPPAIQLGATAVIELPEATGWLLDRFTRANGHTSAAPILGFVGGSGGVGASQLALTAATIYADGGKRAVLVDLDLQGQGADVAAGMAHVHGWRWPALAQCQGALDPQRLLSELPHRHGLHILAPDQDSPCEPSSENVAAILHAARIAASVVVVDLPRQPDVSSARAAQFCTAGVIVIPEDARAISAAQTVASKYRPHWSHVGVVQRSGAASAVRGWGNRNRVVPKSVADQLGLEQWGALPTVPKLATWLRKGTLPPLRRAGLFPGQRRAMDEVRSLCGYLLRRAETFAPVNAKLEVA